MAKANIKIEQNTFIYYISCFRRCACVLRLFVFSFKWHFQFFTWIYEFNQFFVIFSLFFFYTFYNKNTLNNLSRCAFSLNVTQCQITVNGTLKLKVQSLSLTTKPPAQACKIAFWFVKFFCISQQNPN